MAKKKANASGKIKFVVTYDTESEDINYQLEWIKVVIQGTEKQEEEEYNEAMQMYTTLGEVFKKNEMPKDARFSKHFKTKILSTSKVSEAYKAGHGAMKDNNIANKLLEMGILII
jgi:glycyl-tRNA synthetase alpha subunit